MKAKYLVASLLMCGAVALAGQLSASGTQHRYLVERTFAKGVLTHLDDAGREKVNQTNARYDVNWVLSYANADRTKTYCIYEGPDEKAIRDAAAANHMTVDSIVEVPVTLESH